MAELPTKVTLEARRLDIAILPQNFSIPLKDFLVNQNDDLKNVGDLANENTGDIYELDVRMEAAEAEITEHESRLDALEPQVADHEIRLDTLEPIVDNHDSRIVLLESVAASHEARIDDLEYAVTRKKSELVFSGISLNIPTTPSNLVTLLKALIPTSGTFSPFFDTVNDKMVVFNENKSVNFKLSMVGSWPGGTGNRAMTLVFSGTVPDTVVSDRTAITTTDNVLFATFFSVDQGGFMAANGSVMTIQSYGAAFTATTVKMIAEQ